MISQCIQSGLWLLVVLFCYACNEHSPQVPASEVGQRILELKQARKFESDKSEVGQRILGLKQARKFESDKIELYTVDQFLTDQECDKLVTILEKHLVPSALAGTDTNPYDAQGQKIRTSRTAYLTAVTDVAEKAYMHAIAQKISKALGISLDYAEEIQGQCYLPGQEFKGHLDSFEPGTTTWKESGGLVQGNRTWTFMIYLTDVKKGGTTYFSKLDHHFFPKKGQAVVWNNLDEDGRENLAAYHSGQPVRKGKKVIITQWFRQHSKAGKG